MNYSLSSVLKANPDAEAFKLLLNCLKAPGTNLIVVPDNNFGRKLNDSILEFLGIPPFSTFENSAQQVILPLFFPALEFSPLVQGNNEILNISERILARHLWEERKLHNLSSLLIFPLQVLFEKLEDFGNFVKRTFIIKPGQELRRSDLIQNLIDRGYERVSRVTEIGQFCERGGIVDIYCPLYSQASRIELDSETIFGLRTFDVGTQRSVESIDQISVSQVFERNLSFEIEKVNEQLIPVLKERSEEINLPSSSLRIIEETLKNQVFFPGAEYFIKRILKDEKNILELQDDHNTVELLIYEKCEPVLENIFGLLSRDFESAEKQGNLTPRLADAYFSLDLIKKRVQELAKIGLNKTGADQDFLIEKNNFNVSSAFQEKEMTGIFERMLRYISPLQQQGYKILFCLISPNRRIILEKFLKEKNVSFVESTDLIHVIHESSDYRKKIVLKEYPLEGGFVIHKDKFVIVSENELFPFKASRARKLPYKQSSFRMKISDLGQLKDDDYVVHEQYGIGKFHGLKNLASHNQNGEFLEIEYHAGSKLFVPVYDFLKVGKYHSPESLPPQLTALGSGKWEALRQKIKNEIANLTGMLLKTHAARVLVKGYRFIESNDDDLKFAELFPHVETDDQSKAIHDVLVDMASDKPMDRLVCGDVGFGKTEVALRAAYKAVQSGKQVAILAPTTLLVEQHCKTFQERFESYPIEIAAMTRFSTRNFTKETIAKLYDGKIDIILGTHKLLQKDIFFKDLGLLIIDEEHKFGVAQKERLKKFRVEVDVLTLSATPIPRTLQQALHGTRDLSVIETAPIGRRPIGTRVDRFSKELLAEAIDHELARGGQVYIVQHLIAGLADVLAKVRELRPDVKSEVVHGRMSAETLSETMRNFYDGEIKILVSTAIVESGLDVPNANTLIILGPEDFGLAQLYQLRGRVGRSDRRAMAYFLYENYASLTDDAKRRLAVIESQDSLGNGFKLALQDMEIRGAGSLFGKDQSGHVQNVGYDTYFKILDDAVSFEKQRRGLQKVDDETVYSALEPEVNLGIDLIIPQDLIPDMQERLILYQKSLEIKSKTDLINFSEEFIDRFGLITTEVDEFFKYMLLRNLCIRFGINKLLRSENSITVVFVELNKFAMEAEAKVGRFKKMRNLSYQFDAYSIDEIIDRLLGLSSA